jgi:hypothetical protein
MKYLSKLMSMLLIGGMLFTIGCTDYDSDIKNLQDRVDEVENELQKEMDDRINALDADLSDVNAFSPSDACFMAVAWAAVIPTASKLSVKAVSFSFAPSNVFR